jgi:hypothetical protein
MGRRVEDEGGSERRPVIGRIGVEPPGEITPRESGLTSLGCLRTRPSEQLTWEAEQMTAAYCWCGLRRVPLVSPRPVSCRWSACVGPTGFREGPWERLERHKPKGLRVVLRGLGSSNAPRLPGGGEGNLTSLPDSPFGFLSPFRLPCINSVQIQLPRFLGLRAEKIEQQRGRKGRVDRNPEAHRRRSRDALNHWTCCVSAHRRNRSGLSALPDTSLRSNPRCHRR